MILDTLKAQAWKIATILAGVVSLSLVAFLIAANFENRDLMSQRQALAQSINDPKTGYIAQLSQARTNVETLKVAIDEQRKRFQAEAVKNNASLRAAEQRLAVAQAQTKDMEVRLNRFLSTAPKGDTPEEQLRDIDRRGLEEMVQ